MIMDYFEKLKELITHLIMILDEEYAIISELLHNMDLFSNMDGIQQDYYSRLEQLKQLRELSHRFLTVLEQRSDAYRCANSGEFSSFVSEIIENGKECLEETHRSWPPFHRSILANWDA